MIRKGLLMFSFVCLATISVFASGIDDIKGEWLTQNKKTVVGIQSDEQSQTLQGKIVWVDSEDRQNVMGKNILQDLKYDEKSKVYHGKIYIPRFDTYKDCTVRVEGDKMKLDIPFGFKNKEVVWERKK